VLQYDNPDLTQDNLVVMGNSCLNTSYRDMEIASNGSRVERNGFSAPIYYHGGVDHVLHHNVINTLVKSLSSLFKAVTHNAYREMPVDLASKWASAFNYKLG
jgi:hypothetical protein